MIMTQERALLKARQQLQGMEAFVKQAAVKELRIDQVERELFSRLLALGHNLLEAFVAAQGDGDAGPELPADGHTVRGPWAFWIYSTCWNGSGKWPICFIAKEALIRWLLSRIICGNCWKVKWAT